MEEICIIGGGICGAISAKISLSHNLTPVIFEKSSGMGGIWRPNSSNIGIWNSLRTNVSKYNLACSDHPWPADTPAFPTGDLFYEYLSSYISKFNLLQYFQFNTTVSFLEKEGENYLVTYQNNEGSFTKVFKCVIIATGSYSRPNEGIKHKERFDGEVIQAGNYREPSVFAGKDVVVVGRNYSAGDIAYDALKTAKSVTQIYRHKSLCMPRFITGIPYDLFFLNFESIKQDAQLPQSIQANAGYARVLIQLFKNSGDILEDWRVTEEELDSRFVGMPINNEEYYEAVSAKKIKCVQGNAVEYTENGILLEDGTVVPGDVVVPAIGYVANYDFLSEKLKKILQYDPTARKFPVVRFRNCLHPALPGLAFVGNFYTVISAIFELSCEIGVRWVKGLLNLSQEEMWEGVRLEERLRMEIKEADWAYDYIGFQKECFRILGIEFDLEMLQRLEYSKGPIAGVFFFKDREGYDERVEEFVRQIKIDFPGFPFN